ncbi:MAG: hypothetical protein MRJ96_11925 [Nitrospirales bacterium]|nr:hypothetical protein [Nitrospira sp.]MDR4502148.1 hypothetical protein [Nitrospirales bacterium]
MEACYDFYFLLEYLFSDGQFKADKVKKKFQASPELQEAIQKVLDDSEIMQSLQGISKQKYQEFLEGKSPREISDFFVELRGRIHHQSKKNKKTWHPANQQGFKFEGELFTQVCFHLMMKTATDLMYGENVDLGSIKTFRKVSG